jgi:membrane associated rhomboid family serine protease
MFLIPIGNDCGALRRVPAITFALIALCFVVYSLHPAMSHQQEQAVQAAGLAALNYYGENPDLRPAAELQEVFDRVLASMDATERREARERIEDAEGDAATRPERQAELDRLTAEWMRQTHADASWRWGLIPAQFSLLKLFTYMFIHTGLLHLFFNMLFLYLTGPSVEDVWGRPLFLAFYLAAGLISAGLFVVQDPSMTAPLVGASGAVAGVMGAFAVRYPTAKIKMMFLALILIRPVRLEFSLPAWLLLGLWFGGEYFSASKVPNYTPLGGGDQVAYWAHVWGFVFGAVFALGMRWLRIEERFITDAIAERRAAQDDPISHRLALLLDEGRSDEACRMLAAELSHHPDQPDLVDSFWHLVRLGSMAPHAQICMRLIRADLAHKREAEAIEHWLELSAAVPQAAPDTWLALQLYALLGRHARHAEAIALLEHTARRLRPEAAPEEWEKVAETCLDAGLPDSEAIARRALRHPRLAPDSRRVLEQKMFALLGSSRPGSSNAA